MKLMNETIGQRCKRMRLARSLTILEIAQELGIAVSTYREWEYGRAIRGEPYVKLAKIFEVTLSELLTGEKYQIGWTIEIVEELEKNIVSVP